MLPASLDRFEGVPFPWIERWLFLISPPRNSSMLSPRRLLATPALYLELLEDRLPPGDLGFAGLLSLPQVLFSLAGAELVHETPALPPAGETQTQPLAPRVSETDSTSLAFPQFAPRAEAPANVPVTTPADGRQLVDVLEAPVFDGDGGGIIQDLGVGPNVLTHSRESCPGSRGLVQSETTIAVYDSTVIVGFNDFRGLSCPTQGPGYQLTGWAYSLDGGETFTEGGPLPGRTALRGDPWLTVGPDGTFYFASLHNSGMSVHRGTVDETGINWSDPTIISQGPSHDKEAITVDPNTGYLYLTYTRFGGSGGIAAFRSYDGGLSFDGPVTVNPGVGQGSFPVVGPEGQVYVAWNIGYPSNTGIGFGVSTDYGETFSPGREIASVCNFLIPGFSRGTHPLLPTMAVDLSGGAGHGTIYVAFATACGGNGDVALVRSSDGGKSWSDPIIINDDGTTGIQWYPSVSVDALGNVNVFFYDRRENPGTTITDLYFAQSQDGGDTFTNIKVTDVPSTWTTAGGESPNYGDYINSVSVGTDAMVAYADGRDGDPDTYFTRVSLIK